MPGFSDGIIPETDNLGELVCERCDLRAVPLEFEYVSDYETFAHELNWQPS
jgi:hypothetical protein